MDIVKADENDLDDLYGIIVECARWLNSKDLNQWRNVCPKKRFINDLSLGVVYKSMMSEQIIGTATLNEKPPEYYPSDICKHKDNAWYLCRFAVSSNTVYRGLGVICMD